MSNTFYTNPFVPVTAFQYDSDEFYGNGYPGHPILDEPGYPNPTIQTMYGVVSLEQGDWVIRYPDGQYQVCKDELFSVYFTSSQEGVTE